MRRAQDGEQPGPRVSTGWQRSGRLAVVRRRRSRRGGRRRRARVSTSEIERPVAVIQRSSAAIATGPFRCCSSPLSSCEFAGGPNRSHSSHNEWTSDRGPVTMTSNQGGPNQVFPTLRCRLRAAVPGQRVHLAELLGYRVHRRPSLRYPPGCQITRNRTGRGRWSAPSSHRAAVTDLAR